MDQLLGEEPRKQTSAYVAPVRQSYAKALLWLSQDNVETISKPQFLPEEKQGNQNTDIWYSQF